MAEQAAGLILRKPVIFEPTETGGQVDEYWEDFRDNVDGYGGDLDAYARRLLISSLLFGHAATLVDHPAKEPAPNLLVEREMGYRPYFVLTEAASILGWRKADTSPISPITQVRINEYVSQDVGRFAS